MIEQVGKTMCAQKVGDAWSIHKERMGLKLGEVAWYPRWGCYVFHPRSGTVFSEEPLAAIAGFIKRQMDARK